MKTVGIIGGLGPESTIEYYRLIFEEYRKRQPDGSAPSIILNSVTMKTVVDLVTSADLEGLTKLLRSEIQKLANAGVDFAVISANTPHLIFDELQRQSPIPLLSIVEAAADAAHSLGLTRLALFATRFTVRAGFFSEVFARRGIRLFGPDPTEQDRLHDVYMNELVAGEIRPESREFLLRILERLKRSAAIQGVILGGTELCLLFREPEICGIPALDTTRIHVQAIVDRLLS